MSATGTAEAIAAIRAVRLAAHELANVCGAIVGGVPMAVSLPTISEVGKTTRGLSETLYKPGAQP